MAASAPAAAPVASTSPVPADAPVAAAQAPGLAALHELAGVRVKVEGADPAPASAGAPLSPPAQAVQPLDLPVEVGRVASSPAARPAPTAIPLPARPGVPPTPIGVRSDPPATTEESLAAEYGAVEHWKKLPAPIQQQLRDLPFNVHIYSPDPKLRFVKSGGRTLREGDEINGDLRMLHITRDGVIVGYKGGKYWMRQS